MTDKSPAELPHLDNLAIEMVEVDKLIPYAKNSRTHTDEDVAELAGMMQEFGWTVPIVIRKNVIAAGHARLRAAQKLGLEKVPVIRRDDMSDEQFSAYVIADNRIAEKAGWDRKMLVAEFDGLQKSGFNLAKTGFSLKEADDVRKALKKEQSGKRGKAGEDDVTSVPSNPITQPGDIWQLNDHRVFCGDSLRGPAQVREKFGVEQVHAIITDPPYAIYGSATGISSSIADDKMVRPFFEKVLELAKELLPWFAHCYMCCDWRSWPSIWEAGKHTALMEPKNLIIWDKGDYGMGNNYFNCYECIGFFAKLPQEKTMTGSRETGQRPIFKPNIQRFSRPAGSEREHNAAKPVALMRELIENSTAPGDTVLEPFGGSGSTLIGCDQTERRCLAIEIEPNWVDVIVWRWMRLTGGVATLQETGQTFEEVARARGLLDAYTARLDKLAEGSKSSKKKTKKKAAKKKASSKAGGSEAK